VYQKRSSLTFPCEPPLRSFDPDWNPAIDQQALARVWRSGQQKACFVYRFFAVGSIEEVCYERQCSKEGLAGEILDGDGGDSLRFSEAELKSLFSPNFQSISNFHARSKCNCCSIPGPRPIDERGYQHLLPGSAELMAADPCMAKAGIDGQGRLSLVYAKVTDAQGLGFPHHRLSG